MFTSKVIPNPNYRGERIVAQFLTVDVCECGSENIGKRYTHDADGDVDGISLVCKDCGKSDSY